MNVHFPTGMKLITRKEKKKGDKEHQWNDDAINAREGEEKIIKNRVP